MLVQEDSPVADRADALGKALANLHSRYAARTPESARHFKRACRSLAGGNTRNNLFYAPYPLRFERAQGAILTDVDGAEYVDLVNDFTVALAGHSHPVLLAAARAQLDRGMSYGGTIAGEYLLAEAIRERFPAADLVRFVNSGTEANLYAFLLARVATGRRRMLVFEGGYHGGVMHYASASAALNVDFDFVTVPFNDTAALAQAMAAHGGEIAGIAIELMLNTGGCIPATPEFAAAVAAEARRHGAVLIVDEVMSARLGFGGLQERYGIEADLTTLGKFIGGGFSIGAMAGRRDLLERFDTRLPQGLPHGGSFNNNVMSMNVGLAALTEVHTPEAMAALNARGDRLRTQISAIFAETDIAMNITGIGSVMNIQLGAQPPTSAAKPPLQKAVCDLFHMYCLLAGFWIAPRGLIALSLANDEDELIRFQAVVRAFCEDYRAIIGGRP